jgi:hypothetical protein
MSNEKKGRMFRILIDTSVWLDLAKDYQQQALLSALEELIRHGDTALILPRIVIGPNLQIFCLPSHERSRSERRLLVFPKRSESL